MADKQSVYSFCIMQAESIAVLHELEKKEAAGGLSQRQQRQLTFLRDRQQEGQIWLMPPLIFAAANHAGCREFLLRASRQQQENWKRAGLIWLHRYPAFLNRVGWQERQTALCCAGIFAAVEENGEAPADKDMPTAKEALALLKRFLAESWTFLWSRLKQADSLGIAEWEELLLPWEDGPVMESAMAAVLLCMANLQKKPVRNLDQLWRSLRRLKHFSDECVSRPAAVKKRHLNVAEDISGWPVCSKDERQQERIDWLLSHFKNPHRPAYIREKGRLTSEWLDTLYEVMDKAGLPRSACESLKISNEEVVKLLDCFEDKLTERQYMTFLLLYTVSRELVKAGQMAAGNGNSSEML